MEGLICHFCCDVSSFLQIFSKSVTLMFASLKLQFVLVITTYSYSEIYLIMVTDIKYAFLQWYQTQRINFLKLFDLSPSHSPDWGILPMHGIKICFA